MILLSMLQNIVVAGGAVIAVSALLQRAARG